MLPVVDDPALHGVEIAVELLDAAEDGRKVDRFVDVEHFLAFRPRVHEHLPAGLLGRGISGRKDRAQAGAIDVFQIREIEDEDLHGLIGHPVQLTVQDRHALMIEASVEMYRSRERTVLGHTYCQRHKLLLHPETGSVLDYTVDRARPKRSSTTGSSVVAYAYLTQLVSTSSATSRTSSAVCSTI